MAINKRFPADTTLTQATFLNDKKIDSELYAYLQGLSYPNDKKETVVNKSTLPKQTDICGAIGIKSPKTLRVHLNYLLDTGYLEDCGDEYHLPNKEEIYFLIPLETTKFLHDCLTEKVVKVYIYLAQRWKYKGNQYTFTVEDIAEHIGINLSGHSRNYEIINNALICLMNNGLIDFVEYYENKKPIKRLINFSLYYKDPRKNKKCR